MEVVWRQFKTALMDAAAHIQFLAVMYNILKPKPTRQIAKI